MVQGGLATAHLAANCDIVYVVLILQAKRRLKLRVQSWRLPLQVKTLVGGQCARGSESLQTWPERAAHGAVKVKPKRQWRAKELGMPGMWNVCRGKLQAKGRASLRGHVGCIQQGHRARAPQALWSSQLVTTCPGHQAWNSRI